MYQYRVVSAPTKTLVSQGLRGTGPRFALRIQSLINALGAEGWEYVRADSLPAQERRGLASKATTLQNFLIFRRAMADWDDDQLPETDDGFGLSAEDGSLDALWQPMGFAEHLEPLLAANQATRPKSA